MTHIYEMTHTTALQLAIAHTARIGDRAMRRSRDGQMIQQKMSERAQMLNALMPYAQQMDLMSGVEYTPDDEE